MTTVRKALFAQSYIAHARSSGRCSPSVASHPVGAGPATLAVDGLVNATTDTSFNFRALVIYRSTLYDKTGRVDCNADAVVLTNLKVFETYRWIIVYRDGLSAGRSDLICALDMGDVELKGVVAHTVKWAGGLLHGSVLSLK